MPSTNAPPSIRRVLVISSWHSIDRAPRIARQSRAMRLAKRLDVPCRCVSCGILPEFVAEYRASKEPEGTKHTDLFAQKDNKFVIMTVDHILPVTLGGCNRPTNMRVMCAECNTSRGHRMTTDEVIQIVQRLDQHISGRKDTHKLIPTLLDCHRHAITAPMIELMVTKWKKHTPDIDQEKWFRRQMTLLTQTIQQ